MKAIIGRKIGMSQLFTPAGDSVGVTLISCLPNHITLVRDNATNGYAAVQLALPTNSLEPDEQPRKKTKDQKIRFAVKKEFKLTPPAKQKTFTVTQFTVGDIVTVVGTAKGKGFQGVVKRHGFKGGPASHGHRHVLRKPGSIGSSFPQHVSKGKKMAGRMGGGQVTVKNLKVMWVDPQNHILAISGAVPGTNGSIVAVSTIKTQKGKYDH